MYAIFEAKGKQWRAEEGQTIRLPSLDAEPGDRVVFDRVLLAERDEDVLVGRPVLKDASVAVEVTRHGRGEKVIVFKRKKRKKYRRKYGHRQDFTEVQVVELDLDGASAPLPSEQPEAPPEPEAAPEEAAPEAVAGEEEEAGDEEEIDVTGAAAELAEEHDVDLAALEGTGKDGRILKSDVQEAVEAMEEDEEEDRAAEDVAPEAGKGEEAPEAVEEVDITGAARELAEEHDLDYTTLEGTGKDGRILKSDVREAIDEREEE